METELSPSDPGASILDRVEANTFPAVSVDMVSEGDRASAENSLTQMQSPSLRKAFHDSLVAQEDKFRKLIFCMEPEMREATRNAWVLRNYYAHMREFLAAQSSLQFQPMLKARDLPPQDQEEFKKFCAVLDGNDALKFHEQIHKGWDREWECMPTQEVRSERENIKEQ